MLAHNHFLKALWFQVNFVIDFHNYSHTILSLATGPRHFLVKMTRALESTFGRLAQHCFCVTKAMKEDLQENWGIRATVLYDQPLEGFRPIGLEEKHDLFERLGQTYPELKGSQGKKKPSFKRNEFQILY